MEAKNKQNYKVLFNYALNGFMRTKVAVYQYSFRQYRSSVSFIITLNRLHAYPSIGCYFLSNKIQFAKKSVNFYSIFNQFIDRNHIKQRTVLFWTRFRFLLHENFNSFKREYGAFRELWIDFNRSACLATRNNKKTVFTIIIMILHVRMSASFFPVPVLLWWIFICGQ